MLEKEHAVAAHVELTNETAIRRGVSVSVRRRDRTADDDDLHSAPHCMVSADRDRVAVRVLTGGNLGRLHPAQRLRHGHRDVAA